MSNATGLLWVLNPLMSLGEKESKSFRFQLSLNESNEGFIMVWNLGIDARDTNLYRLLQENERAAKKAYIRKVMPCATESELEGFL